MMWKYKNEEEKNIIIRTMRPLFLAVTAKEIWLLKANYVMCKFKLVQKKEKIN